MHVFKGLFKCIDDCFTFKNFRDNFLRLQDLPGPSFRRFKSVDKVDSARERFQHDFSTKLPVSSFQMDKDFGKSSKLLFLYVDLKIHKITAYCRNSE